MKGINTMGMKKKTKEVRRERNRLSGRGSSLQSGIEKDRKTAQQRLRRAVKHGNGLNERQPAALTNVSKRQNDRHCQYDLTGTNGMIFAIQ